MNHKTSTSARKKSATLAQIFGPCRSQLIRWDTTSRFNWRRLILPLVCLAFLLSVTACRTVPPLPPADFSTQDWHVQQGQALWKRKPDAPELAGDLLVATNQKEGRTLVQFTKTPLPLVVAQTTPKSWQIEIPAQKKFYSGRGKPPTRLAWFYLPGLLQGAPPPKGWTFKKDGNNWELHRGNKESITGFLED